MDDARDIDFTRHAQPFNSRRHVDAIAVKIIPFNHDVAEVDANPEHHLALVRELRVAGFEFFLNGNGRTHGLHGTAKLGHHAVPGGAEDATFVVGDQAIDDLAMALEGAKRGLLIRLHEPAIADHVGGKDRRKPALNALLDHSAVGTSLTFIEG